MDCIITYKGQTYTETEFLNALNNVLLLDSNKIANISVGERRRVVQYLFNNILSSVDISKDFTNKDIVNRIKTAYDDYISTLNDISLRRQYNYLQENKDSILGVGEFDTNDNTVKSELESFLSQTFELENDPESGIDNDNETNLSDVGIFQKNQNKAAYENDVRTSLSTKMKMFFSGIKKENKQITEEFAGLDEYYTSDEVIGALQDMLVNVSNDPKSFKDKVQSQIDKNPQEFGFLQQVLDKFNTAEIEVQNEILFRLNQTKNDMFLVVYSKLKNGSYKLQVLDANSKNPNIKTKIDWQENFKQSPFLVSFGDTYRVREDVATSLIQQFNGWKGRYADIPNQEYIDWLSNFGIQVSDKTIQDYKTGMISGNSDGETVGFESHFKGGLFNILAKNLEFALNDQVKNSNKVFKYKAEFKNDKDAFNILTENNNGYLKTLIDVEVNNTFNIASSMYIAGKTINAYSQPNYTSEQLRKLKDFNDPLVENLNKSAFSKNSLLLNLIQSNSKIKNALGLGYVSLESLKENKSKQKGGGITDLSSQDYDLLLQGFFQNEGAYFANQDMKNRGISLREMKMTFPTLSDSSQMFVFNTVGLNLNKGNFNITSGGDINLNNEVLEIMYSQLVKPDLDRIQQYINSNKNTNIQGHNLGSQLFTMLPAMNTLKVNIAGHDVKLLTVVHKRLAAGATVEDIYSEFKDEIHNKLNDTIKSNVSKKIRVDGETVKGTWIDNGFLDEKQNPTFLDSKYLNSKGSANTIEKLQLAAFDYTVNYYINQAQIQMLFGGDISNYVGDKQEKKFSKKDDGTIDVTKPIVSVDINEDQFEAEQKVYNDIIKATSVNMSKRMKELISPGNRIANSKGEQYIQLMVNDVEESSTTIEHIIKQFYPDTFKDSRKDISRLKLLEKEIKKGIQNNESVKLFEDEYKAISNKLQDKFPDVADYFSITGTDAQEYTSWKEHLHILLNTGRITKDIFKSLTVKLESQGKDGVNEDNKLSKEEKKIVFQPIKPLHAGMYFEDVYDNNSEVIGKNQRYVYVKTSSFPLLPEMTSGLELDNLRKNIETLENKTGKKVRISYQSGNKVGAVKSAINMSELYVDEYNADLENKILGSSITLDRDNFSIQQDKPFKTDKNIENNKRDEINRGTQFEKIILGNGVNKITKKIFPFNGEMISGVELYQKYTDLYNQEQRVLKNQLYNSLGLDFSGEWNNNIETLEHIKSALDKRLSNKQDKEILELSYVVPTLENGKYVNKYYTKEEVKKNGLKPVSAEFNIPVWMSPNSRKFESVLNSIVNNKLINLKLPGFSSPVASQEGFKIKEEADIKNIKGIVYSENYDANEGLKATYVDGELVAAQIMVASKFRIKKKDENGKYKDELIDLSTYTKTLEDGRTVLDMDRISPELLQMFSFRIPTSAHQSGVLIEIVGFLPHEQGDLMIVPKDHTTQLGEDYDIDTRYVYTQNYRIDSKGNIRIIDAQYIQNRIDSLEKSFENEREWEQFSEDILNIFDEFKNNEEIQNIFAQDNVSRERKHQILKDSLNHLLIENNIVEVYKAVFSSTDGDIQRMIGATLSTKFAEDTASAIEDKLNSTVDESNFSIFDDEHQKSILRLGASGKLGIGVHSNWVVLNSLFQQMETPPQIVSGFDSNTGKAYPWSMRLGNFRSEGKLGQIEALRPIRNINGFIPRLLSVINMESQNSSTDNQKLQIMGRRNENKYTINVFALMSNLGFDKDMVNGKEMSLPSLFISQPIIRRYVELKENFDSITTGYQENIDDEIFNILLKEYGEGVDIIKDDYGTRMSSDQMKTIEETQLTGQALYDSLIKGTNAQQWAVFEKFIDLNKNAANINKVQQLANIDSGLGVSYFNTIDKKNNLIGMNDVDMNILGISKMFGDKITISNPDAIAQAEQDGYVKIDQNDDVYIKPTSPLSAKIINGISSGYNLWSNVIPFENQFIDNQIDEILTIAGKESGTRTATELKYKVVSDMKDFIYSYSNLGIFDTSVEEERKRLFFDNDNNESLASYLNKLKKNKNELFNQPFFKELDFILNKGDQASIVKYSSNDRTAYNKNSVYNQLSILNDSTTELPDFNGQPYTHEMLAKDLTKYALLSNQENGAIGFRQHIPMSIFNKYKVTENLRKHSGVNQNLSHNLLLNGDFKALTRTIGGNVKDGKISVYNYTPTVQGLIDRINTRYGSGTLVYNADTKEIIVNNINEDNFKSVFVRQFFQHNPDQARKLNFRKSKGWLANSNDKSLDKLESFTVKDNIEKPQFYSIRDAKNNRQLLFEKDNNDTYRKVSTLGEFGYNEYSPFTYNAKSMIEANNVPDVVLQTVKPVAVENNTSIKDMISNHNLSNGLLHFMDNIPNDSKFKDIANLIRPFISDIKVNTIDLKGMGNALYVPLSENNSVVSTDAGPLNRGEIYVSEDLVASDNTEKLVYAIMEEAVHSVTVNEVNKYVDTSKSYLDTDGNLNIEYKVDDIPPHIVKLISLFKQGSKHILDNMATNTSLEDAISRINDQKKLFNNLSRGIQTNTDTVEPLGENFKRNVYRTLNLGEFIAGVMLDDTFRKEMNNVEYRSSKESILSQFAKVITKIVDTLAGGNRVPNSITTHTFDAVMALLQYENDTNMNNASPIFRNTINATMIETDTLAEELLAEFDSPALESPDSFTELADPSLDNNDSSEISLQPITINDMLDIPTC